MENLKDTEFNPTDEEIFFFWEDKDGNTHEGCVETTILAKLLVDGVLFVGDFNSGPFFENNKVQPKDITACVWVNCNDLFAWACADCEPITMRELPELYKFYKADPKWGTTKWCCRKRNLQPQRPVIESMKKDGVWDEMMENLEKNKE